MSRTQAVSVAVGSCAKIFNASLASQQLAHKHFSLLWVLLCLRMFIGLVLLLLVGLAGDGQVHIHNASFSNEKGTEGQLSFLLLYSQ